MTPAFRAELIRKSIHLSSLWMAAVMYLLPHKPTIALFAVLTILALIVEHLRHRTPHINALFKGILREHEQTHNHTGSTWMLFGALFASLFPDPIAVTAMVVLTISDTCASLIGMRFGRHKMFGKSLEGSAAFFLSGLAIILLLNPLFIQPNYMAIAIPALAITTLGELLSTRLRLDDNFFIPSLMCVVMLLIAIILPSHVYAADFTDEIPPRQEFKRDLARNPSE